MRMKPSVAQSKKANKLPQERRKRESEKLRTCLWRRNNRQRHLQKSQKMSSTLELALKNSAQTTTLSQETMSMILTLGQTSSKPKAIRTTRNSTSISAQVLRNKKNHRTMAEEET
jgi:magnesium-transporting ATPase (P-type)